MAHPMRRLMQALAWRLDRWRAARRAQRLGRLARRLGLPRWDGVEAVTLTGTVAGAEVAVRPRPLAPWPSPRRAGQLAGATVCTLDRLHFARTLAASFRRHHPAAEMVVLVVDAAPGERPRVDGATVVGGEEIGFPPDPFHLLALDLGQLCRLARPLLLRHLVAAGSHRKVVFLAPEIWLQAPLGALLDRLDDHDFVVVPRMLSPLPHPERWWARPRMASLAAAGVFDDGLFGLRRGVAAGEFLEHWGEHLAAPRAFEAAPLGLDWLPSFADSVDVLRDAAYGIAYWNLHERALRHEGGVYTVDGRPLVAFHFSGFDPLRATVLSPDDGRHDPHHHGPLTALLADHARRLTGADHDGVSRQPYRFGRFASGLGIDGRMRRVLARHPSLSRPGLDPFGCDGERHYGRALLSPAPGSGSLVPPLLAEILDERPDLRRLAPDAETDPTPLLHWFASDGAAEYGYADLFDRHRPVVPTRDGLATLEAAAGELARLLSVAPPEPLGAGRTAFVERHRHHELAEAVREMDFEHYAVSPLWLVRRLVDEEPGLRELHPDLLHADAEPFARWLDAFAATRGFLPAACVEAFRRTAGGRSLARVHAHLALREPWMEELPLALVGRGRRRFAQRLLGCAGVEPGLEIDDVVMYLWLMEERPEHGLELTLSLPCHRGQDAEQVLAPVLDDRRFAAALDARRRRTRHRPTVPSPAVDGEARGIGLRGVDVCGYFKSPIGLGYMSRGLAAALAHRGVEVAESVEPHAVLDHEVLSADFVAPDRRFPHAVFVGVPYDRGLERRRRALEAAGDRFDVAYLAWEQGTAPAHWAETFHEFDQLWALSDFAAASLAEALRRDVATVPCALDLDALPPAADKRRAGLAPERFNALFVFDPESSVERKNPLAAVDAFAAAFRRDDHARLVLRLANYRPARHRPVADRLAARAAEHGVDLQLVTRPMDRAEVLGLISAADCYLSLHRAEGFGLTCAEAMAYGVPTVATRYSGNLTFMDDSCSLLVDFEETEVRLPDGPFHRGSRWAEPSVAHAAECLRRLYEDRDLARRIGERGRRRVGERLGLGSVGEVALAALEGRAPGLRVSAARVAVPEAG